MNDEIKVTQAGMSDLIERLRDAVHGIEGVLHSLDEQVAKLRGGWTGNEIPIEYLVGQIGYQLAPPLIMVGLASLVGLLFLRAAAAGGLR